MRTTIFRARLATAIRRFKKSWVASGTQKGTASSPLEVSGMAITDSIITPQKVTIMADIHTLTDVPALMGDLQWI